MKLKLVALIIVTLSSIAFGVPPNTITMDGRPVEYDATELRGTNPQEFTNFGEGNVITNLYVTWDAGYLYFALQGWEVNDKLTIMLDVDPGAGTGATTTTNWVANPESYIAFNDVGWTASVDAEAGAFGLDYQIASEGFYNNIMRVRYNGVDEPSTNNVDSLFDRGNGATPAGTPVDMVVLANDLNDPLKGIEARIPWPVLYTNDLFGAVETGKSVPTGASIRVFAVLHNNDTNSSWSSDGIIPNQTNALASYANGQWVTANYITITIDEDGDGMPDLSPTDLNPPYLTAVSGAQGKRQLYAQFNEDVSAATATNIAHWLVGNDQPESIAMVSSRALLMVLTNDLPAAGTLIKVEANGVEDTNTNFKTTFLYLNPAATGIETSVTVRFVLQKNSGMGLSSSHPTPSAYHINGSAAPLAWGYPPDVNTPLTNLNATQVAVDVVFPPGSSQNLRYKYSATISGTNNYEAIRMLDYTEAARELTLPLDGSSLVVTDYLGAAAAPLRAGGSATNYVDLYDDPRRPDPGVRQNALVTFKVDLSERNVDAINRVILLGSDPLRGFNLSYYYGPDAPALSDYPVLEPDESGEQVGWEQGGIEMYDDGTNGDDIAGDGVYAVAWEFTTDGYDGNGTSLVAGDDALPPYYGSFGLWTDARSPRSFDYKFAVLTKSGQALISPEGANLGHYLGESDTAVEMAIHVWANENLPPPPPSNAPAMLGITISNNQSTVEFEGTDLSHGLYISTNLSQGWLDFGHRAVTTATPQVWRATVSGATVSEHYAAFSGLPQEFYGAWWTPNPIPLEGGNVDVYFRQHSRVLAGSRDVQISGGLFNDWGQSPMTFIGDGTWHFQYQVPASNARGIQFKFRSFNGTPYYGYNDSTGGSPGDNYILYQGDLRATWSPAVATNNQALTIYYDASTGPFTNSTQVNAWLGYGEPWSGSLVPMTNTAGSIWEAAVIVPETAEHSVNFVFNNQGSFTNTSWDSENDNGGRRWTVFIARPEE